VRRIPAALTALALVSLSLAGCASAGDDGASCERATSQSGALAVLEPTGALGDPSLVVKSPLHVDKTVFADETVGDGPRVTSDLQDVVFTLTISNGSTGETLLTSGTEVTSVGGWRENYAGLAEMMTCATEGSRIVGAVASDDLSPAAAANFGLNEGDSLGVVLDLEKVYLAAADGVPQYNDRAGMPSVVLAPDGTPGITIPDIDAPTELVVEVLKKGDGPAVGGDDSIRVQYTGITWEDKTSVFDSTWEKGQSAAVTLENVVPGFAEALDGQTVGSQLLVVIPPDLGYGDEGSGAIPGGATLVFVIDVLGVDAPAGE
jgi:hypothetical protein